MLRPAKKLIPSPLRIAMIAIAVTSLALVTHRSVNAQQDSTALARYLAKADTSYQWKVRQETEIDGTELTELRLVSQTWRDIPWKHQLFVIVPESIDESKHALLLINGGSWNDGLDGEPDGKLPRQASLFATLARQLETPVVIVSQVPHQPLFDGKREDALISHTFVQYVRSGDDSWPLLLPMVKSVVRGMDAAQEYLQTEKKIAIETFTVTGASKRGWTTWLTGAVDKRATAIAPMVIDMLNMPPQMKHQITMWGDYSPMIDDYTEKGLQNVLQTDAGKNLRSIVDPYSYVDRLTQPKLIINGTNDPYWPVDALNLYWNDLQGEKYILYVPNQGHGINDYGRLIGTQNGLHRQARGLEKMPKLNWKFTEPDAVRPGQTVSLVIDADEEPTKVQIWYATNDETDFRKSRWKSKDIYADKESDGQRFTYKLTLPASGAVAFFGEAVFQRGKLPCFLSTNVQVFSVDK